jgi:ABC-type transporter Mla subunit MlaD
MSTAFPLECIIDDMERGQQLTNVIEKLRDFAATLDDSDREYQRMEKKLADRTSALNDVHTYLSSVESLLARTRDMFDPVRAECTHALNAIEDSLHEEM